MTEAEEADLNERAEKWRDEVQEMSDPAAVEKIIGAFGDAVGAVRNVDAVAALCTLLADVLAEYEDPEAAVLGAQFILVEMAEIECEDEDDADGDPEPKQPGRTH